MADEQSEEQIEEQRQLYRELLEELRTISPGVQVLFAFLLTVPFAARFAEIDHLGKIVFSVALLAVAAATFLFMAPAAYHRVAHHRDRRSRLQFGVRTALTGLALLGASVTCVIFVVVRFLYESTPLAIALAGATALFGGLLWAVIPLLSERKARR